MTPTWAQQREALLRDCIVSPDVFTSMVERLGDFVMPYQRALETEASQRNVHRYLQGLLSHVDRKNAEEGSVSDLHFHHHMCHIGVPSSRRS